MAFSAFGNQMGSPGSGVQVGSDLEDIQTEALGFSSIASDAKLQLLPTPWPTDQLPPATASLMSIASRKQLIAAAGPDVVILASTEAVRRGFEQPKSGGSDIRPFQPQSRLPMPMRISQLAFSADENYLVLSAENGGGLAVYETQALLNGSTQSAFELPTNGQALRALLPNPTPEKADLFAVVTLEGNLMIANLKERSFVPGPNGQVLKSGVSCVAWSVKGKQLVAGLADGTVHQMTPEGVGKGDIPKPPNVTNGAHVSALFWLENLVFLTVHTPQVSATDQAPESIFHIVTKSPADGFTFQKLIDPAGPFGVQSRSTPHHFMLRLKDYPPNLQDLIAVASTASTDIGLFTRSRVPLTNDKPADKVTGVFTLTEMFDDSRRAQLPVASGLRETSPIGFAFDFSSTEKVLQPIPSDPEISESPTPLPLLTVLNNDGVLSAWWVVYNESIRERAIYPGMVAAPPVQTTQPATTPKASIFGSPVPSNPFGSAPSTTPAFGAPSAPGAFGAPSGLGQKTSVWGASSPALSQNTGSTFGAPAFGSSSALGSKPAFGSSAMPGSQASPWATGSTSNTSAFGQSSFGKSNQPFGSAQSKPSNSSSGGFASFASTGGFASAPAQPSANGGSIFGQKTAPSIFGTAASASPSTDSPFGVAKKPDSNAFGSGAFVLGSTFKADPSAKDDGPPPPNDSKNSFFGGAFTSSLSSAAKPASADLAVSEETDMDTGDDNNKADQPEAGSTTPASTPAPPRFGSVVDKDSSKSGGSGLFSSFTPVSKPSTGISFGKDVAETPKTSLFGSPANTTSPFTSHTPAPGLSKPILPGSSIPIASLIKSEPKSEEPSLANIPAAPLPPDITSKDAYVTGDTSNSSTNSNDAPLPPDFMPKKPAPKPQQSTAIPELPPSKPITADMLPPLDVPGGPSSNDGSSGVLTDDEGSFEASSEREQSEALSEEGSGEDVANDLSPASDTRQTPAITPSHSFGRQDTSVSGDFFQVKAPVQPTKLFGEVQRSAPILPPPKITASPRSPSPIRSALPGRMLRPEGSRSVSAPGVASKILGHSNRSSAQNEPKIDLVEESRRRAQLRAQQEAEEAQRVLDVQDDDIPRLLASELEPSSKLAEFVAHTDYVGTTPVESIPQQAESVYRDINSMVDTLGLNVRALQAFMLFQNQNYHEDGLSRTDLEDDQGWVLEDLEPLSSLISKDLTQQLAAGKLKEFSIKLEESKELEKEVHKLRAKKNDIQKLVALNQNDTQNEVLRSQPLSAEQTMAQHELRRKFTKFQTQLSQTEEALTTLKARIVSDMARSGRGNSGPSSDAIKRTIAKMTTMAEKRSGDIDVLEGQIRSVRLGSSIMGSGRENSPISTPQKNRSSVNFGTASTSRFYTPDSIKDPRRSLRSSVISNSGSPFGMASPRKKLSGYTADEKLRLKSKLARKKEVMEGLRSALARSETRVRPLGDD